MNKNLKISEIKDELLKSSSFAIICHTRPDGDAIGSSSALKKGLISIGKRADVFCEDPGPEKFSYLGVINDYSSEIKGDSSLAWFLHVNKASAHSKEEIASLISFQS